MSKEKQYGLIIPKKDQKVIIKKPLIFNNSSDEEENVEQTIRNEALRTLQKRQTQLEMQKALTEDPSVYEYDNIYDDLQKKKEIRKITKKKDTGPKYIESLLKSAENRKKEYERRTERKIQKEREEEGDEFAGKEEFVTSSYKQKMEEMQKEEEEEQKRNILEARLDVTKQSDLSGFYRHILKETTDDIQIKEEKVSSEEEIEQPTTENSDLETVAQSILQKSREKEPTQPRSKDKSSTSKEPKTSVDNDSEFSVDSESSSVSSSSSKGEGKIKLDKNQHKLKNGRGRYKRKRKLRPNQKIKSSESGSSSSSSEGENQPKKLKTKTNVDLASVVPETTSLTSSSAIDKPVEEKSELDIATEKKNSVNRIRELFKKRHVGEVFESAKERYFARKAAREAARAVFA